MIVITVFINLKPSPANPLYQGQYLRATFANKTIESSIEIPRNAVFDSDKVFTVSEGVLAEQTVNIHLLTAKTAILSGLKEGSMVVTEPLINVSEGMKAEILN